MTNEAVTSDDADRERRRFKAMTDPRAWASGEEELRPLSLAQSNQLASDILSVAQFYNVPVELMIGVGAMENNYLNAPGDLDNGKWKRYVQPGDIVLATKGKWVLVKNDSTGVWQVTRDELRHAHRLYLRDHRDYTLLPEALRPPKKFTVNRVSDRVLTTYAGLLLRDLLDRYRDDSGMAAGAYNGGWQHPNIAYAAGVDAVSSYARQVIDAACSGTAQEYR